MSQVKELPHDLLAEKSLLSCLIIDSAAYDEVGDMGLSKEDFYSPKHGLVFEAIRDLATGSSAIDYITVCSKLGDLGKLELVGGQTFILELSEDQASSVNIVHYAKIVKDKSVMRQVIRAAQRVAEAGMQFSGDTRDFITDVESSFFKLTSDVKGRGLQKLNTCLTANLRELENDDRRPGEISGLSTGFVEMDKRLLGMQAGQLLVLAARPGMGKTALALNLALNACRISSLPVTIYSLEMLAPELSLRILSSAAKVDSKKMKTKNFHDMDLRNIGKAVRDLSGLPVFINDSGDVTIFDIQSQARKIKSEYGLGMVVVDYLQLLKPHNPSIPREQQISEMSRGLKVMAKELACPVLVLSQLNRGVESRGDKRPQVSDLRESGAIEQDADVVMMIYRDDVYNPDSKDKGIAEIIIGKNRAGESGVVKLSWVGSYTSFFNLASEPAMAQ